jgi:hypothetical protein
VLRVVFYTGKSTYYAEADSPVAKKTVQVVNRLVEWYKDSDRTIYVDCFYTSRTDLLKSLAGPEKIVRDWNDDGKPDPPWCSDCKGVAGVQKDEEK